MDGGNWFRLFSKSTSLRSRRAPGPRPRPAGRPRSLYLFERTLADREQLLGDTHPSTLTSRNNLAYAYQAAGRLAEAEAWQTRAEPES
jgi:Tetratricopeptide repeat